MGEACQVGFSSITKELWQIFFGPLVTEYLSLLTLYLTHHWDCPCSGQDARS